MYISIVNFSQTAVTVANTESRMWPFDWHLTFDQSKGQDQVMHISTTNI